MLSAPFSHVRHKLLPACRNKTIFHRIVMTRGYDAVRSGMGVRRDV